MGRRKNKDGEMLELVIKLGGLAIILSILNPTVRNFLTTLGSIAILLLILAIVVLFVVFVFKFIRPSKSKNDPIPPRQENYDPARNSPIAVFPPCDLPPIEHSAHGNIIEKLRAIDWFQFEKLVALAYEKQGYHVTRRGEQLDIKLPSSLAVWVMRGKFGFKKFGVNLELRKPPFFEEITPFHGGRIPENQKQVKHWGCANLCTVFEICSFALPHNRNGLRYSN